MADTGIFAWLDRAERCGDRDVERAAIVMKDYYQGVGPEPEYAEQDLASRPAEVDDEGLPDIGRPDLIPEPQMKVLGKEYLRRTKGGYVDKLVVLREIIQRTYSQAYQKGISRNGE